MNDPPASERSSRLRQALRQTEEERARRLDSLVAERGPMVRGSFVSAAVRCGKPGCKCSRGEPHATAMLRVSAQGTVGNLYVPRREREQVQALSRRYQRFRKSRAALVKLGKRTIELVDSLQDALTEPYPPADRDTTRRRKGRRGEPPP